MNRKSIVNKVYSFRWEIVRFSIVGIFATFLHYGVYLILLHFFNITETIAYTIGYAISLVGNFFLSNYFTFKTKPTVKKGFGFGLFHFFNYVFQIVLLNFFLWIGLSEKFAPIPIFAIVIPTSFVLIRTILKTKQPQSFQTKK